MYEISPKLVSIYQRSVSKNKIEDLIMRISSDPKLKKDHDFLIDMRPLDYTPTCSDIKSFSEHLLLKKDKIEGLIAIVTLKSVHYELFQLASHHMNEKGLRSEVFTDEIKAISWLEMKASFA